MGLAGLNGVGWITCKKSEQTSVYVAYGENMNVHVHKNRATSRHSSQRRNIPEN